MPRRINDEYHIKVYILYLFEKMASPLSHQTTAEIILWDGTVNYFVFMDCFEELKEAGLLEERGVGEQEEPLFVISAKGSALLASVENALLEETKKKVLRSAARLLAYRKDGKEVHAEIRPEGEGYILHCTINDRRYPLMDLSVYLDQREEAEYFASRFDERADIVYRGVLALLTGEARCLG
ncbi:MAG: DUF4364 family protein [Clostridia bacterium]|nr:DUF4364 family protein [Clostridia bacterium]